MNHAVDAVTYKLATHCVVRQQEEQYLIYNTKTDELHLLSPISFYLYSLCDGVSPLNELQEIFAAIVGHKANTLQITVADFLNQLLARGIIELTD
ncbi:MAG: PqqD family protein [Gallionella sp.]|nr:PqqD family protein [Gallionella sp.]